MPTSTAGDPSGLVGPFENEGAPVDGTDEVQSVDITGTPTGGDFTLTVDGFTTAAIAYDADAATAQTALEALPNVEAGDLAVSGSNPNFSVTYGGNLGKRDVSLITADGSGLTGGSSPDVTTSVDTPGVEATKRGAKVGAVLTDTTNGKVYVNEGTPLDPTWTVVGTQT